MADGTGVLGSSSTAVVQWWAGHTSSKSGIKNDLLFSPSKYLYLPVKRINDGASNGFCD